MTHVKKEALVLSKYFLSLPHPAKTTLMIFALSFLFGVLTGLAKHEAGDPNGMMAAGIGGVFLLGFPAMLSAIGLFVMRRKAIFRRSIFLALLTVIFYGVFFLSSIVLSGAWAPAADLTYVGFACAFVLWYFTLLLAFDFRKSAFLLATMQMVFFLIFYLASGGFASESNIQELLVKVYLGSFVFLAALYAFFYVISAPMKKNLGISSMDALSMFASQWLYGEKDLEEVFDEMGEEAETLVWLCEFSGRKNRAMFVVPYIHYGPFGNLGGSEFTQMISESLLKSEMPKGAPQRQENCEVFVFHGTATHDFNPVSSGEIGEVVSACHRAIRKLRPEPAKMSFSSCRMGTVRASAFHINESAFVSYSRAPRTTEDVSLGLGLALMENARRTCKSVGVVDEHNAETGDITSVEVGSPIGFEMLDATRKLFDSRAKKSDFKFGCASANISAEAVGRNGLKLALFSQGKKMNALLLVDSNGILPEFRSELVDLFVHLGKECGCECHGEVMTTDTHQINTVKGVLNPLGTEQRGNVCQLVRRLFYEAKGRLEEVKFDSAEERFRIKVFGSGQSVEIASTINAVVAVLRIALPLILIASALVLLWALGKI